MVRVTVSKSKKVKPPVEPVDPPPVEPVDPPPGDPVSGTFKGTVTPTGGEAKEVEGTYNGTVDAETREFNVMGVLAAQSGGGGSTVSSLIIDGVVFSFASPVVTGQYAGGGYWAAASGIAITVSLDAAALASAYKYLGGTMVDPGNGSYKQGFDNRTDSAGTDYDVTKNAGNPVTITLSGGAPKTLWAYRGRDAEENGGGNSWCFALPQLTIVASDPGATALKPPGVYCAGGKPIKNTGHINYSLYTPMTKPASATEPNWDLVTTYEDSNTFYANFLSRPLSNFGRNVNAAHTAPCMYQWTYGQYVGHAYGSLLLGCLTNLLSGKRQELINRVVQAGMEVKGLVDLGYDICRPNGAHGIGLKALMFFAGRWLGDSTMTARPSDIATGVGYTECGNTAQAFFNEDGYWRQGSTRVLFGRPNSGIGGGTQYAANHLMGDIVGNFDSHNFPVRTGTAQSGSATTIRLAAGTNGLVSPIIEPGYMIYISSGQGAGQARVVKSWNDTTKDLTIYGTGDPNPYGPSADFSPVPNNTSVYAYSNGGTYQTQNIIPGCVATATAVVLAGEATTWNNALFIKAIKQHVDEDGQLNSPSPYNESTNNDGARLYGDATPSKWTAHYYAAAVGSWPT